MKHQYTTESLIKRILQRITDFFVDAYMKFFKKKNVSLLLSEPENILFVSLGHLGDALILSYIFPLIRAKYPNSKIDVLAGEWCKPILEGNPYVRSIIVYNHLKQNRSDITLWKKNLVQRKTSKSALSIIRSQKYDLSIEGRISHPNGNLLCYRGRIKRRIGFGSGGFGSFLTDEVLFPAKSNFHMLDAILEELKIVKINGPLKSITPYYTPSSDAAFSKHPLADYFNNPFIILQMETGKSDKFDRTMNKEFWLEVVRNILGKTNYYIIVCGTSEKSSDLVNYFLSKLSDAKEKIIDAINKLSLDEFFILSKYAKAAFTLDSLAAHMCAINCETISFYKNCVGTLFFPISNRKATVIHNHLLSRDAEVHPNVNNHYVEDMESNETYEIVNKFIVSLNEKEKATSNKL